MAVFDFDSDPEIAKNYDQGPRTFVPGYEVFQGLAAVIHGSSDLGIRSNATRLLRASEHELGPLAAFCPEAR